MTFLRRRAVWLAASVLLVQVIALAASAAIPAICCRRATTSRTLMDCCKGKGHSCPLMKKQQAPPEAGSAGMKSCPGADERVAALLFGARGVLAVTVVKNVVPPVSTIAENVHRTVVTRYAPVETPPPRA